MYKTLSFLDIDGVLQDGILCLEDNALIPPDSSNIRYQQYLAWLAEGNTPEEWKPE
jgi:hypothetical protein